MKTYSIQLDGEIIGRTDLEKADAPMGVVIGMIKDDKPKVNYDFIKSYCQNRGIELASDYPKDKLISTMEIKYLKVISPEGVEIKGLGNQIEGMDGEGYHLILIGIPYPFYGEEFPHHVEEYNDMFKS